MKKVFLSILTAGLAVSMISDTGIVYGAEETINDSSSLQTGESKVNITFKAPSGEEIKPMDPKNPEKELSLVDGNHGKVTEIVGPLSLNYVSHFNFDEKEISSKKEEYNSNSLSPFIQVSDLRGTGEGWHVMAEMKGFKNGENPSLQGSYITLKNTTAISAYDENNLKPVTMGDIQLHEGEAALIANAEAKTDNTIISAQGLGTWLIGWLAEENTGENHNVTLTVPGAVASSGEHTATINWTLIDGPYVENTSNNTEATD